MLRTSRANRPGRVALAPQARADAAPGPGADAAQPVQDGALPADRDLCRAGPGPALLRAGGNEPHAAVHTDAHVRVADVDYLFCPGAGVGPADTERRQRDGGADCGAVRGGDGGGHGAERVYDVFLVLK